MPPCAKDFYRSHLCKHVIELELARFVNYVGEAQLLEAEHYTVIGVASFMKILLRYDTTTLAEINLSLAYDACTKSRLFSR